MDGRCYLKFFAPLVISLFTSVTVAAVPPGASPIADFSPDTVLVSFHPGSPGAEISEAHRQAGGSVVDTLTTIDVQVVSVPTGTVLAAIQKYQANPNVKFAEPNYRRPLFRPSTNEGSEPQLGIANNFNEQWSLHNTGQGFGVTIDPIFGTLIAPAYKGVAGADIDALEGWVFTTGDSTVAIAVLDSGVSCLHADLVGKCVEQVNFVAEHGSSSEDVIGHGTHVAAIAAAKTHNDIGTAGVAPDVLIGAHKVCYEDYSLEIFGIILGFCEDQDVAEAITYAADHGYQVINMSLAGPQFSNTLQRAVDYAWNLGVVLVAGAGNDYLPDKRYPAAYANVIAVAATDQYDNLAYFSTFSTDGDDWVSVAAPGHAIMSAVPSPLCGLAEDDPEGCYDWKSGTSMSAPIVSGVAALLWSHLGPGASNTQVRNIIETSADTTGALGQNLLSWTQYGRVNLYSALLAAGPGGSPPPPSPSDPDTIPPLITGVISSKSNGPHFSISWKTDEPATSVVIFSTGQTFSNDSLVTSHVMTLRGSKNATYTYHVRSADAAGNVATSGPHTHVN